MRVTAGPLPISPVLDAAISSAGANLVAPDRAEAVVWEDHTGRGLRECLAEASGATWVQVASAGVDWIFEDGLFSADREWTCAKGDVIAGSVAEMALILLLSGFRDLKRYIGATTWQPVSGRPLAGSHVCIVGAGGVGTALLSLLAPFSVTTTVIRRTPGLVRGATSVELQSGLLDAVRAADATVLAAPLTAQTVGMIGDEALAAMKPGSWLINVSRGALVDTGALLESLESGHLGGAALDVTDPEPLPRGHPLWSHPRAIITPHIANNDALSAGAFARRVSDNLGRRIRGEPLVGLVDPGTGY